MEIEISAEARSKSLNRAVALTVVTLSVFMGLAQVKDGNIVQAMQQAQSDAVDYWGEYQATKTKLHIDETALAQGRALAALSAQAAARLAPEQARLQAEIAKYRQEIPQTRAKAEAARATYDALNVHDDQFDASDALLAIAVSVAAVSALAESFPALAVSWAFGAGGLAMGLAGFFGAAFRLGFLARLLG